MAKVRNRPAGPPAKQARGGSGIGRESSARAEAVSDALRREDSAALTGRRRVFGLALGAAASLGVVGLYQSGIVRHLPDPPLRWFDSDKVDASGEAYANFATPDSAVGIISYGVTAALAGMGAADRATERPWLPLALAAKTGFDALGASYLTAEQLSKHRKLCGYCLVAAAASLTAFPAAIPEARMAWRTLRRR